MTIVYEPVCSGAEHSPVNAALLATALAAFSAETVAFFAEREHLQSVKELLPSDAAASVEWRELSIAARDITDFRRRFPLEQQVVKKVLNEARQASCSRIISCATTLAGIAALKARLIATRSTIRAAVVHHTGLSSLIASRFPRLLLAQLNGNRVRHLVLGDWIRERVVQAVPSLNSALFSIWHPYLFCHSAWAPLPGRGPIRFGFLGAATEGKGFDRFCELAEDIQSRSVSSPSAEFELVGRPPMKLSGRIVSLAGSEAMSQDGFMTRALYEERIKQLHYSVFPFRSSSYDVVTSGSFIDTFAYLKPCIVLRHPVVEAYFNRMGDIGYICDSPAEMYQLTASLVQAPPTARYAQQCKNLLIGRQLFEPSAVAVGLQAAFA
jgi:hypothetical protein